MKKIIFNLKFLFVLFFVLIIQSCKSDSEAKKEYINQLIDLHNIECEHLNKAKINVKNRDFYEIRATAFQEILKNPNRALLARYELLFQYLAQKEFLMTDKEKKEYYAEIEKIYGLGCQ